MKAKEAERREEENQNKWVPADIPVPKPAPQKVTMCSSRYSSSKTSTTKGIGKGQNLTMLETVANFLFFSF